MHLPISELPGKIQFFLDKSIISILKRYEGSQLCCFILQILYLRHFAGGFILSL